MESGNGKTLPTRWVAGIDQRQAFSDAGDLRVLANLRLGVPEPRRRARHPLHLLHAELANITRSPHLTLTISEVCVYFVLQLRMQHM